MLESLGDFSANTGVLAAVVIVVITMCFRKRLKERGAASVAHSKSPLYSPSTNAACWICFDGDHDGGGKPILRDCSCRGDDAGFAHLSCLVKYAQTKFIEALATGKDIDEPWQKCPQCHQEYQREVSLDMARSYQSFINERYGGVGGVTVEHLKVRAFAAITRTISKMDYKDDPKLIDEGKRAANHTISMLERLDDTSYNLRFMDAYFSLAKFLEAEGTTDSYQMALNYYEKLHDLSKSEGDESNTILMKALTERMRSKIDGGGQEQYKDEMLMYVRASYYKYVREQKEDTADAITSGSTLARALNQSQTNGLECERLLNKLAPISRQVLGPEHPTTKDIEFGQKLNRVRLVEMSTDDSIQKYEAGGYSDEEEKYVAIRGPLSNPRIWDEEQIKTVAINDIIYLPGTAVVCHGLKNAAHLNGKIGDVRSRDTSNGRFKVRFEDKSLKSALVKPENLRIVFELPDE